jgi:hypothetical protein
MARWVYAAGLAVLALGVAARLATAGLTPVDRQQQLQLVEALADGDLAVALERQPFAGGRPLTQDEAEEHVGIRFPDALFEDGGLVFWRPAQASPPGYGVFALPFHLALSPLVGAGDAYVVAALAALTLLGVAVVAASRAAGVPAWSPQELVTVGTVVLSPVVLAALTESFHPSDLLAAAAVIGAVALLARRQVVPAALLLGAGLYTKQWVIVAVAVLACLEVGRDRLRVAAIPLVVAGAGLLPFLAADARATVDALGAPFVARGANALTGHLGIEGDLALALFARILPLAVVALLCLWLLGRSGARRAGAAVAIPALAAALLVRPILDPAGFVYYAAPAAAVLPLVEARLRGPLLTLAGGVAVAALAVPFAGNGALWRAALITAILLAALAWSLSATVRHSAA